MKNKSLFVPFFLTIILMGFLIGCETSDDSSLFTEDYYLLKITETIEEAITIADLYNITLLDTSENGLSRYKTRSFEQYHALLEASLGFGSNELIELSSLESDFELEPLYESQNNLHLSNVSDAYSFASGNNIVMAIIDTGIDTDSLEFEGRILETSYNSRTNEIGLAAVEDDDGHGTLVASVAAAASNGQGIIGVAPNVDILVIKANYENTSSFRASYVIEAILYAIDVNVDIINLSLVFTSPNAALEEAVLKAHEEGIVVVAASGNSGKEAYHYPASYDSVISVGSVAENSGISFFSTYNDKIDLVAQGSNVITLNYTGDYINKSGTSFASPLVAGVVALLKEVNPSLTPDEIMTILKDTATDLGDPGKDIYYGHGLVDAYKAVTYDLVTTYFNTYGAAPIEPLLQVKNTILELPEPPSKPHYLFEGWYLDSEYKDVFDDNALLTEDLYLHAKYQEIIYTIQVFDGEALIDQAYLNYEDVYHFPHLTKAGFTLIGFEDMNQTLLESSYNVSSDNIFNAIYQLNQYDVNYYVDEALINQESVTHGSMITNIIPSKTGHTFNGWALDEALYDVTLEVISDIDLHAMFEPNSYQIYYYQDASLLSTQTEFYGNNYIFPEVNKEGYTFLGFETLDGTMIQESDRISEHVTLSAVFDINTYTVNYYMNETLLETDFITHGNALELYQPTLEGYVFEGWLYQNERFDEPLTITESMDLYAIYELKTHLVRYFVDETIYLEELITHKGIISNPTPIKTGHIFTGWKINEIIYDNTLEVTNTLDLVALFEPNLYRAYYYHEETLITVQEDIYGTVYDFPEVNQEGFTFLGFETLDKIVVQENDFLSENITLTAIFEINTYLIQFLDDNDEILITFEKPYGSNLDDVSIPNGPDKVNHTFVSWDQILPETMPSKNVLIRPIYTQSVNTVEVMVTFIIVYEDGTTTEMSVSLNDLDELMALIQTHNIIWPVISESSE